MPRTTPRRIDDDSVARRRPTRLASRKAIQAIHRAVHDDSEDDSEQDEPRKRTRRHKESSEDPKDANDGEFTPYDRHQATINKAQSTSEADSDSFPANPTPSSGRLSTTDPRFLIPSITVRRNGFLYNRFNCESVYNLPPIAWTSPGYISSRYDVDAGYDLANLRNTNRQLIESQPALVITEDSTFRPQGRSNRSGRAAADADIFEGLPVRQWKQVDSVVGPPVEATVPVSTSRFSELPLPREFQLLSPMSQMLLRAARAPRIARPYDELAEGDDEKERQMANGFANSSYNGANEQAEREDPSSSFITRRWVQIPRNQEEPEFEFLAKRRKIVNGPGTTNAGGVAVAAVPMRKTKVRRVDAEGNSSVWEVLVPEGDVVEGEVVEEDVTMAEAPPVVQAAPGTVVEGVGVVNDEGVVVAESLLQPDPTPQRRRPPPPRRKPKKGPGRGKKKVKFNPAAQPPPTTDGAVQPVDPNAPAVQPPTSEPAGVPITGDVPMKDGTETKPEEDDEEGSEDGESGDDDDDKEDGELSDEEGSKATPSVAATEPRVYPTPAVEPPPAPTSVPALDTAPAPALDVRSPPPPAATSPIKSPAPTLPIAVEPPAILTDPEPIAAAVPVAVPVTPTEPPTLPEMPVLPSISAIVTEEPPVMPGMVAPPAAATEPDVPPPAEEPTLPPIAALVAPDLPSIVSPKEAPIQSPVEPPAPLPAIIPPPEPMEPKIEEPVRVPSPALDSQQERDNSEPLSEPPSNTGTEPHFHDNVEPMALSPPKPVDTTAVAPVPETVGEVASKDENKEDGPKD